MKVFFYFVIKNLYCHLSSLAAATDILQDSYSGGEQCEAASFASFRDISMTYMYMYQIFCDL